MTLQPGQTLAHYRAVEPIGEGGMGVVWRAIDTRLGREVALKLLPEGVVSDPQRLARLEGEARALAALNHPNIVTIHAIEERPDGSRFLVMELISGRTLAELIPGNGLSLARFLGWATPLADAIRAAHDHGIVHRDLKPRNVMVDVEGRLKVLDFGFAGALAPHLPPPADVSEMDTPSGPPGPGFVGTPHYMAPEQIRGDPAEAAADLFSLGVVFYEMATGRRPFDGRGPAEAIASVLKDRPIPPSQLNPAVPERLERLILASLEKEPARRPASAAAVCRELGSLRAESASPGGRVLRSIAVLPFADMSPEKDQGYFCEGIAEEILLALGRIKDLRVTPRTSSFGLRAAAADARTMGERLGVATLLDGSVRKAAGRLRIAVELIDTQDGVRLWSESYDRVLDDVFKVQEEIARSVVAELQLTLSEKEQRALTKAAASHVDAYDYYLRGRQYFYQYSRKGVRFALDLFTHAIEADPGFARAYAGVSDCHSFLFLNEGRQAVELEGALQASLKALALDPELAEAHASLGVALSLGGQPAAAAFEEAIRLDPLLFEARYFYARDCFARGDRERAASEFEAAMRSRPEDYQAPLLVARTYDDLGRAKDAIEARRRGVALAEERLRMAPDDSRALYMGANGLVALGRIEEGLLWADRAAALDPTDPMVLYNIACIKAMAGVVEPALDCLERAIGGGLNQRGWVEHDNNLDNLRGHPRFAEIIRKLA